MIEPFPSLQEESEKQLSQTETQTREVLLMLFPTLSTSTSQVRGGPGSGTLLFGPHYGG